jgi:hypothetical protein
MTSAGRAAKEKKMEKRSKAEQTGLFGIWHQAMCQPSRSWKELLIAETKYSAGRQFRSVATR